MKAVDRRTDTPAVQSCVYKVLARPPGLDSPGRTESMAAAAISVLANLARHLPADAAGVEASLVGSHRMALVHGSAVGQVAAVCPAEVPQAPARRICCEDLEDILAATLMYCCTVDCSNLTEDEVEAVMRTLRAVGKRNDIALQSLAAAVWCLVRCCGGLQRPGAEGATLRKVLVLILILILIL